MVHVQGDRWAVSHNLHFKDFSLKAIGILRKGMERNTH